MYLSVALCIISSFILVFQIASLWLGIKERREKERRKKRLQELQDKVDQHVLHTLCSDFDGDNLNIVDTLRSSSERISKDFKGETDEPFLCSIRQYTDSVDNETNTKLLEEIKDVCEEICRNQCRDLPQTKDESQEEVVRNDLPITNNCGRDPEWNDIYNKYTQGILSGAQIKKELEAGNIVITDFDESRLNPNSYNVRLDNKLLIYNLTPGECLDMKKENKVIEIDLRDYPDGYVLLPGVLYLGSTMETAGCKHNLVPMMAGRSSCARLGMGSDYFAAFGDVGFGSKPGVRWTFEITVVHPLRIYPGTEIAQVYFITLAGEEKTNYTVTGKYAHNNGVQPSLMYKDYEKKAPFKIETTSEMRTIENP